MEPREKSVTKTIATIIKYCALIATVCTVAVWVSTVIIDRNFILAIIVSVSTAICWLCYFIAKAGIKKEK